MADGVVTHVNFPDQAIVPQKAVDLGDDTFAMAVSVQGSAAVTGALTDTELRAADVPVTLDGEAVTLGGVDVPTGAPVVGQVVIAVTGTAVALSAASVPLPGGSVFLTALSTNTAVVTVGGSGVTNTVDGSGNGLILGAGGNAVVFADDLNKVCVNGTAGDIVSYSAG